MKKLEEILRDKPIKNKLSFAFRIMDILYVVLALVAVVELIRSKGYIGSIVVVVLLVLAIIFNASMSKMLAKMLIDPITNLVRLRRSHPVILRSAYLMNLRMSWADFPTALRPPQLF